MTLSSRTTATSRRSATKPRPYAEAIDSSKTSDSLLGRSRIGSIPVTESKGNQHFSDSSATPSSPHGFGTPRHLAASFILSFNYLIRPACGIIGLGFFYLLWSRVELAARDLVLLALVAFFGFWFGAPILVGILVRSYVAADAEILILRRFSGAGATAAIARVFGAYGRTTTVLEVGYAWAATARDPYAMILAPRYLHFDDDDWKEGVSDALKNTDIAVVDLLAGSTEQVKWEVEECIRHLPAHRILSILPRRKLACNVTEIALRGGEWGTASTRFRRHVYRAMKNIAQHVDEDAAFRSHAKHPSSPPRRGANGG